ncbi:MAG: tetratricopeptide repeat protein [Proteobacteria bacterium]|nr:tetratricopeptide repeat protein [Pseudomonadota bacterium]
MCGDWAAAAWDGGVLAVAAQNGHSGLNLSDSARKAAPALHGASPVKFSSPFRCFAAGAAFSVFVFAFHAVAPASAKAQTPRENGPSALDLSGMTASGSYLAARHAGQQRDALAAAAYYRSALRRDPKNAELLDRAFLSLLVGGDINEAVKFADRVVASDKSDRVSRLVMGVHDIKIGHFATARRNLAQSVRGPITDLTATLLTAWSQAGAGDAKAAVATIDRLSGPDWYGIFKDLHAGLILDAAGQKKDAGKRLERAYKQDPTALRVVEAYGGWLSRNKTSKEALDVFEAFDKVLPRHPLIVEEMNKVKAGDKLPLLVTGPQAGGAEALYGLGASLGRRGGEDLGLVYLQLALHLSPSHPLALLSLADLYESLKKPDMAIKVYERIPANSPLYRNASIQMAADLDALDRGDEAQKRLEEIIKADPKDLEAILALGNLERGHKKFAECGEAYTKALDLIGKPEKGNWTVFYFRGICYERSKQWPKAEADLKKALELFPDQPHVLNYLGYSWIDQGVNLDEGMAMIKKAVAQRPDDGYIVDSLGWAYYRLGNYEEATKELERAIGLKPEDPTINDHLGDAYWRVGRKLEATFQWAHARDLKPDPDELPKILQKLQHGLPQEATSQANSTEKPAAKQGNGG